MAHDTTELVVASHGDVYVAPTGTTLPTDEDAALAAAFVQLGFISEDGVTISVAPEIEEFPAWQSRSPVRRELVAQNISLAFALEQWNAANVVFAFGGGVVTQIDPDQWKYAFPDNDDALDERAVVIDWQDGASSSYRAVFSRASVTETVETNLRRSALAMLPITLSVLAPVDGTSPGYILANDAAFAS